MRTTLAAQLRPRSGIAWSARRRTTGISARDTQAAGRRSKLVALPLALALATGGAATQAAADGSRAEPAAGNGAGAAPYLEYLAGVSFVESVLLDNADGVGAGLDGGADLAAGYVLAAALGARFLEHFRAELQLGYQDAEIDELSVQGEPDTGKGGVSLLTIMANAYLDLDLGLPGGLTPWVGAGLGWGLAEFEARNSAGPLQLEVDDTDGLFVWNAMAGATLPFSESVAFSVGYRYVESEEMTIKSRAGPVPVRLETDWSAHQLIAGLRLQF